MWNCPRCGPRRAAKLRHAVIQAAKEKDLRRFLTLTLNPRACTAQNSVEYIRQCWAKFRTYLKRQYGTSVTFISVVEFQKSGYAHLHVLVDRYIAHNWLKGAWQAVGGGSIVDIRLVDIHKISSYLPKYLTKEILLSHCDTKYRRYTTSRDLLLFKKPPKGVWMLLTVSIEYLFGQVDRTTILDYSEERGLIDWFLVKSLVDT